MDEDKKPLVFAALVLFLFFALFFLVLVGVGEGGPLRGLVSASTVSEPSANSEAGPGITVKTQESKLVKCPADCDDGDPETLDFCRGSNYGCEHMRNSTEKPASAPATAASTTGVSVAQNKTSLYMGPLYIPLDRDHDTVVNSGDGGIWIIIHKFIIHMAESDLSNSYLAAKATIKNNGASAATIPEQPKLYDYKGVELERSEKCGLIKDIITFPLTLDEYSSVDGTFCYKYPQNGDLKYPLVIDTLEYGAYVLIQSTEVYFELPSRGGGGGGYTIVGGSSGSGGTGTPPGNDIPPDNPPDNPPDEPPPEPPPQPPPQPPSGGLVDTWG